MYTACPSDGTVVLISCLPSPCTRLSRAPTTTETPPLSRDVTGLGGVPIHIGAQLEVPVFTKRTLNAVGGQLYPWQHGSPTTRDKSATPRTRPRLQFVRSRQTRSHCKLCPKAVYSPYRGFRRRLQRACQSTRVLHRDTCCSLPKRGSHLSLQAFNAARLLQLVVPTSTRFAAPLLAQLDLSRGKSKLLPGPPRASRRTLRIMYIMLNHREIGDGAKATVPDETGLAIDRLGSPLFPFRLSASVRARGSEAAGNCRCR